MNDELLFAGALRVFNDFSNEKCTDYYIEHDTVHPDLELLRRKYHLGEIAGEGDSFSKVTNLIRWVHDHVPHNGGNKSVESLSRAPISILDYSFGKGAEYGVYCRLQAIVLSESCLSIGILARTLHCLPFGPNDFDSHVVSMAYIGELGKWVLFDQSNNAFFLSKTGIPLSPLEARYQLGVGDIAVSSDLQPRNAQSYQEKAAAYRQYMAKNLFYFKFSARNTYGTDLVKNQRTYHLIPSGFDAKDREIAYCEFAIKNASENMKNDWRLSLEGFRTQEIAAVSQAQFSPTVPRGLRGDEYVDSNPLMAT